MRLFAKMFSRVNAGVQILNNDYSHQKQDCNKTKNNNIKPPAALANYTY